jgi:hypothetical protein
MSELKSPLLSAKADVELEAFWTGIAVQAIEERNAPAVYPKRNTGKSN